jgi:hypothetical protein
MLVYAPELLRRRRRQLVPALSLAVACAFLALVVLPKFQDQPGLNTGAMIVAAIAVPLLLLLLNGEPLLRRDAFEAARLDGANAVVVVARFSEAAARRAQSQFWMRSLRELRLGSVLAPPIFFAFATVFIAKIGVDPSTLLFFALFTLLSLLSPFKSLLTSRRLAAVQARRFPERTIRMGPEGIAAGAADEGLAWSNVARVWEFDDQVTLVLDPFMAIQVPRADLSDEARQLIAASTPRPS